jgi:uncharacterized protein YndB with AHSA1/START domain
MPKLTHSVTIHRPPEDVFAYVVDLDTWPLWRTGLYDVHQTTEGALGAGSVISLSGHMMGRDVEMDLEITEYEANRLVGIKSATGPVSIHGTFLFEPENGGTRLTLDATAEAGGFFRMAEGMIVRQATRMWEEDMATLKGLLEE